MMTVLIPSSWTTFLNCIGSMKTRWFLPHTPLWVSHSSKYLHKSIVTTMEDKLKAWSLRDAPLLEMLHLNLHTAILMTITTWCHPPWVVWDLPHTMGSLDPFRYIFYALHVDQLDSHLTWSRSTLYHVFYMTNLWIIPWIAHWSTYTLLETNKWTSRISYCQILQI